MQPDADAPGGYGPLDLPSHRVYGVGLGGDNTGLMFDMYDAAEQCELDIEGIMGEFHPGQMELNMRYGPALDAADRAFICKEMTRELAARKGYWITYMGRPMAHLVGSGLHINLSLTPIHGGANAFDDPTAEHGLSTLARQCLGGRDRPPRGHGGDVGAAGQQLQAADPGDHRRLLGQLGSRQPHQHLPHPVRAWRRPRGSRTACRAAAPTRTLPPRSCSTPRCSASSTVVIAAIRRSATATPSPTPIATRRTTSATPSPRSRPTPCCARRWAPIWCKAFLTIRKDELAKWEAADGTWDVETISPWELEQYLPFF